MRARAAPFLLLSLVVLVACGDKESFVDAGARSDAAAADAPVPDADLHGVVEVTVLTNDSSGAPAAGVTVVFLEATGALAARTTTDDKGRASASVLPGASVTAVWPPEDNRSHTRRMETVMAVVPGDSITIGEGSDPAELGMFTINLLSRGAGASYTVYTPCGSNNVTIPGTAAVPVTVPVTLSVFGGCRKRDAELVAVSRVDDAAPQYAELVGVDFAPGGSVTQAAAWVPLATRTATWTQIPAEVDLRAVTFVPDRSGLSANASITRVDRAATATAAFLLPHALEAQMSTQLGGPGAWRQFIDDLIDGRAAAYGLDVGAGLLPWLGPPTFDATTAKLTSVVTGSGTGDAFLGRIAFLRATSGGGTGSDAPEDLYVWNVWAPSANDLVIPPLPAELGELRPRATDRINNMSTTLFDVDGAAGYDAVRAHIDAVFVIDGFGLTHSKRMRSSTSS